MSKEVTIELTLTEEEWCELANALESKTRLIERGDYGEGEKEGDNEEWVAMLGSTLDKVAKELKAKGVSW